MFQTFFMGGFECSSHRSHSNRRLDLIAATKHDKYVAADYARLHEQGIRTVREGIRWHLIERTPYDYDFSSVLPIVRTARDTGTEVIWDLCHYGWPDDLDIFSPEFVRRFAGLSRAFIRMLADETDAVPFICPVNEISFFSWASGDVGCFYPFTVGRGMELKRQLVRASIESIEAVWDVSPHARLIQIDPAINVIADPAKPENAGLAESHRLSQYEAWDMLAGRFMPELGGSEKYLDIIGVNYYAHNQWIYPERTMLPRSHPLYRPFREILRETYERYRRPLLIAETGIEEDARPDWLRYVCDETRAALKEGVPVEGICLYPIVNHPGWADDRHCHNGLWDYPDENGEREIYQPLAYELRCQQSLFETAKELYEDQPLVLLEQEQEGLSLMNAGNF
jgi:beta-glucosidase/6-phospho-beta-glucosidase/beta-galactosidase